MRYLVLIIPFLFVIGSCKHKPDAFGIDLELYEFAKESEGFVWFANSNAYLEKSSGSGHSNPKLRTRFNTIAQKNLDANYRVKPNSKFDEGAVIVKELYDKSQDLERYAILFKDSSNEFADAQGWVWGYIDADGKVAETAKNQGKACIGCHQQSGSIDYVLMNKFFP